MLYDSFPQLTAGLRVVVFLLEESLTRICPYICTNEEIIERTSLLNEYYRIVDLFRGRKFS